MAKAIQKISKYSIFYFLSVSSFSLCLLGDVEISKSLITFDLGEKAYAGRYSSVASFVLKALGKGVGAGAVGALLTPKTAAQAPLRYTGKSCIGSNRLPYFYGSDGIWYANTRDMGVIRVPAPPSAYCNIQWYLDQNGYSFYKPI